MLRALAALIAPPRCGVCARDCRPGEPVCARCSAQLGGDLPLSLMVPGIDHAWAASRYEGTERHLIAALKFGKRLALADVAAKAIAVALPPDALAGATLVPVPADPWRRRVRGFDPATEIATALARRLELPLSYCLNRRHAPRQTGRRRAERLASAPLVRALGDPPRRPVLLDDVATTGATLAACAAALRAAGAKEVLAIAFAQA